MIMITVKKGAQSIAYNVGGNWAVRHVIIARYLEASGGATVNG